MHDWRGTPIEEGSIIIYTTARRVSEGVVREVRGHGGLGVERVRWRVNRETVTIEEAEAKFEKMQSEGKSWASPPRRHDGLPPSKAKTVTVIGREFTNVNPPTL